MSWLKPPPISIPSCIPQWGDAYVRYAIKHNRITVARDDGPGWEVVHLAAKKYYIGHYRTHRDAMTAAQNYLERMNHAA